ncbi:MAG: DUF488 domain-containing protein [Methylocapsa sp.]|nr:DUF488 domain-containing protein [Methylocapsa sp.]
MPEPFFTIGHSTRPIEKFIELLRHAGVRLVADVRTIPRSRKNPQFNTHALAKSLMHRRIGYRHIAALGGLRGKSRDVPPETNAFWINESFHNYADYAMTESFREGIAALRELGHAERCAIMCAEALWWRCHRRIITDYLLASSETVFHILGLDHSEEATIMPEAQLGPDGMLTYPVRNSAAGAPVARQ